MDTTTVTVRHVMDDTEPAADTLEALVREYGNTPATGKGRTRTNVLADIRAMIPSAPSRIEPATVPVEQAVADLNEVVDAATSDRVQVDLRRLHGVIFDAHRAGQATGRLLPKESRERATTFADAAVSVLVK